ncbi:peptidylprolyl isomerase [Sorangium cellulosum]|uniref:Peptidyl-prolyl cis-trans isomerase n=1 Tax=Sorangium cellulosum TaxID=56 RepID=A0A4V0NDR0_SORCE|nr:peptidylprolyl isomerase [Sorangium cellulosum]AUX23542.1 peptidylprolyl isomerase [Sorangium cellulosum]
MIARALATQSIPALAALALLAGCSKTPEPTAEESPKAKTTPASTQARASRADGKGEKDKARAQPQRRKVAAKPVAEVKPSEDDPLKGKWTLEDATKGLPPGETLTASIETDLGALSCKLFHDKAPITVANFVGLARGIRPWKTPEGKWEKKPAYDGTIFHRIIKGFMIQGGDAKKNGTGEAGYVIPDEVWEDGSHDRAGLLCMANRGKNTNSAQFFITDAPAFHLDGGYTIFGECGPEELVHKLASVEVKGERPVNPPVIKKVTITRK